MIARQQQNLPQRTRAAELAARAVEYAVVGAASLTFAASYGLNYGFDNQVVYFLKALTLVDHSLLKSDWFTNQTTQYHRVFTLSRELDGARATAEFEHGVLKLQIPKAPHAQTRRIELKVA